MTVIFVLYEIANMNSYINLSTLFIILSLLLLTTSITICSCHAVGQSKDLGAQTFSKFDSIDVFPKSKQFSYIAFRDMKEDPEMFENGTEQRPKTSFVRFVFAKDSANYISSVDKSKCSAFMKGDSLKINIGSSDGFTGYGVTVTCIKSSYTTRIYRFYDSDPYYQKRLHIITEKQTLALDKLNYTIGDSLFGAIYVRQIDNEGLKSYATGTFRAKIEARLTR